MFFYLVILNTLKDGDISLLCPLLVVCSKGISPASNHSVLQKAPVLRLRDGCEVDVTSMKNPSGMLRTGAALVVANTEALKAVGWPPSFRRHGTT